MDYNDETAGHYEQKMIDLVMGASDLKIQIRPSLTQGKVGSLMLTPVTTI